jgi:hypothetical protein
MSRLAPLCLLLTCILAPALCQAATLKGKLSAWQIKIPEIEGLIVEKESSVSFGGLVTEEVSAASPAKDRHVRLLVTSGDKPSALEILAKDRAARIRQLFYPRNVGSGVLVKKKCTAAERRIGGQLVFTLFADSQLRYGDCEARKDGYGSVAVILSCGMRKTVYELYYYFPVREMKEAQKALRAFTCRN